MPDPRLYNDPSPTPQEEPPPPPIQKIIGDALGTIGNALETPGNLARGALARPLSAAITGPAAAIQPEERVQTINRMWTEGRPAQEIFDYMMESGKGAQVPGLVGITKIGTDPLFYLGGGIPGAVGKAVGATGSVARAFEFLNAADQVIAQAPWNVAKGVVGGAGRVLGGIPLPNAIKMMGEAGTEIPAETVGNLLGSPSATTLYKQKVRDLIDTIGSVMSRGHSFEQDLFEESALKQMASKGTPTAITRFLPLLQSEQGQLLDEVRRVQNPTAKVQAMAAFERVQQTVDSLMKQASANQVSGKPAAEALPFYDEARRAIVAGRVLVDRINQNPTALIDSVERFGPGLQSNAAPVTNAFEAAINRIYPAFREAEALRMQPGRPGGIVQGPPSPGAPLLENFQIAERTSQTVQDAIDAFWGDVHGAAGTRTTPQWQPVRTPNGPILQQVAASEPLQRVAQNAILQPHADLMAMAKARQSGLPALNAILPERLQETGQQVLPEVTHQYGTLMKDRANVGRVLNEVWQKARPGQPLPVPLPARWNEIENPDLLGNVVNPILRGLGEAPIEHIVELFQRPTVQKWLSPRSVNGLKTAIARWPEGDLLTDPPYLLTIDKISRDYARQYGVETKGGLRGFLRDSTALWKEMQLGGNPGYLVTNLMGILANSGLEGVSPIRVASHFLNNFGSMVHNQKVVNDDVKNYLAATGSALPHSVTSGAAILADANATKEFLGRGITASARLGPAKVAAGGAALGALAGALMPEPNTPENRGRDVAGGAITGAVVGGSFPAMSELLLRRIAAGMEAGAREDAFLHQAVKGLEPRIPELFKLIDAAAYETKTGVKNVTGAKVGLGTLAQQNNQAAITNVAGRVPTSPVRTANPGSLGSIKAFVESRGGVVNPDWITENLQRAGVSQKTAQTIGQAWRAMIDGANREGERFAGRIHVDYENLNNFEQFMNTFFPFSTWANKMTPFYAEHILTKPAVLFSLLDYAKMSEEARQAQGLPNRFIGTVEDPHLNMLLSAILGRPIRAAWNPIRGFMPFADVGRLASAAPSEDNAFASAYKILTSLGPQPHPLIELGLRAGGAFGTGEPAPPLFSFGNRVLAATGVDLNLPAERGEQAVRRMISGRSPSDMDVFGIDRKVQELALRNLGHMPRQGDTASDPYLKARVDQAGPVWDQAKKEYRQEQALRAGLSLGGQTFSPQTTLTPEEAQIRMERRTPEQGGTRLAIDPMRYPFVDDKIDRLMVQGRATEPMPQELAYPIKQLAQQAFGDPKTWEERFGPLGATLRQDYDAGTVGSLNLIYDTIKRAQIMSRPEMAGYSGGMSPEETQLSAMLASYNNPGSLVPGLGEEAQGQLTKAWFTYQNAGPAFQPRLLQDKSPTGYWLQQAKSARDSFRGGNPMLDQYLSYLEAKRGTGNMQDFLDHYWGKGVTGLGAQ